VVAASTSGAAVLEVGTSVAVEGCEADAVVEGTVTVADTVDDLASLVDGSGVAT
jgi:hypothetical protein